MDIIRKELRNSETLPPGVRYDEGTDTVQTWVDDAWVDTPERDPRLNDAATAPDDMCDGAARMAAFLQDTVQGIIDGIDDDKSDAEIALVVLGVLAIIPLIDLLYVLIAALVGALIVLGSSFLHAAFDSFDWDNLICLIDKNLNADGFLDNEGFSRLQTQITADLDTDPASILNDILTLVGRAGMNDAAALRDEAGDCSGCDVQLYMNYKLSSWDGLNVTWLTSNGQARYVTPTWVDGSGWRSNTNPFATSQKNMGLRIPNVPAPPNNGYNRLIICGYFPAAQEFNLRIVRVSDQATILNYNNNGISAGEQAYLVTLSPTLSLTPAALYDFYIGGNIVNANNFYIRGLDFYANGVHTPEGCA